MDRFYLENIGLPCIRAHPKQPSKHQVSRDAMSSTSRSARCCPTSVYVCAGQSNMVGRGNPAELPFDVINAAAHSFVCYDHDRNFAEKANVPHRAVKEWTPLMPDAQYSYGGNCTHFGPEFGLVQHLPGPAYFVKFAMGSTNLYTDWRPDGDYFREFVAFVKREVASVPQPAEIKALFWLQGESDSTGNAQQVNAYEENLAQLIFAFRREVGHVPVIASQVDFHHQGSFKRPKKLCRINEAIAKACARKDTQPAKCSLLDGEMSTWDDGHLDSASLLHIGAKMGIAYKELQASLCV